MGEPRLALAVIVLLGCGTSSAPTPAPATTGPPPSTAAPPSSAPIASDTPLADVELLHAIATTLAVSSAEYGDPSQMTRLVDGDPATAWNSASGDLVGAWIEVRLPANAHVSRIELTAGNLRASDHQDLFLANHRIARVRVSRDGTVVTEAALDIDARALQPIAASGDGGVWRIEVLETHAGTQRTYDEVCVGELRVVGHAAGQAEGTTSPTLSLGSLPDAPGAPPTPRPWEDAISQARPFGCDVTSIVTSSDSDPGSVPTFADRWTTGELWAITRSGVCHATLGGWRDGDDETGTAPSRALSGCTGVSPVGLRCADATPDASLRFGTWHFDAVETLHGDPDDPVVALVVRAQQSHADQVLAGVRAGHDGTAPAPHATTVRRVQVARIGAGTEELRIVRSAVDVFASGDDVAHGCPAGAFVETYVYLRDGSDWRAIRHDEPRWDGDLYYGVLSDTRGIVGIVGHVESGCGGQPNSCSAVVVLARTGAATFERRHEAGEWNTSGADNGWHPLPVQSIATREDCWDW
jgi:hypothetical protein